MRMTAVLVATSLLIAANSAFAKGHSHNSGPNYGGGRHTSSHGGHYQAGRGQSHRGGHYKNARTHDQYGHHKG